jgi:GntR family histidine utilization transcriptional repressor
VNRALRHLAEAGVLERRRKAGTRVALYPISRAVLEIPILRQEIESRGHRYRYRLLDSVQRRPADDIAAKLNMNAKALHLRALHLADDTPFALEDRWINLHTVPKAATQSFEEISANEWLVRTVPYTTGDISFRASAIAGPDAAVLGVTSGMPGFVIERTTWDHKRSVTHVRLHFAPGYTMETTIGG